ncbi:MAG: HU family DNA-binding protein [Thermosynechococcaceae cyanobacterium]
MILFTGTCDGGHNDFPVSTLVFLNTIFLSDSTCCLAFKTDITHSKAREGYHPQTGKAIKFQAIVVPVFSAGKEFKEKNRSPW